MAFYAIIKKGYIFKYEIARGFHMMEYPKQYTPLMWFTADEQTHAK